MENTGRIHSPTLPFIQRMLFEKEDSALVGELRIATDVDRAHLVMLAERGIVSRQRAARLLYAIEQLNNVDFAPLLSRSASRGVYLLYEDYLIETEGASVGGILQTARSRNDLNATIHKIKLRQPWMALLRECLRFQVTLLRRARRYASVVMPAYTHGQAAQPSSFGHYLMGVAQAVNRHLCALHHMKTDLQCCPLGAGAVAGTTLPIDSERTALLLGFSCSISNSIDAVASRDLALRLLSEAAILGTTLSRVATDLLTWCSAEFAFISLPDEVVGSSSAMPQKRNPFLLEHVQGMASSALGGFVAAAGAMQAKPFTNSIAVGTEALRSIWVPLQDTVNALILSRIVVAHARPNSDAMLERAVSGQTIATALATRIVTENDVDFRTAHRLVGEFVLETEGCENNISGHDISRFFRSRGITLSPDRLDPGSVVEDSNWGGGPSAFSVQESIRKSTAQWQESAREVRAVAENWERSRQLLRGAVREIHRSVEPHDSKRSVLSPSNIS